MESPTAAHHVPPLGHARGQAFPLHHHGLILVIVLRQATRMEEPSSQAHVLVGDGRHTTAQLYHVAIAVDEGALVHHRSIEGYH